MSFRFLQSAVAVALLTLGFASPSFAQLTVSAADIQRLQETLTQASAELQQLRARDAGRASALEPQLNDLRDEVIYLRVKLRRDGSVPRAEYADVRDRIDDIRSRATAEAPAPSTPPSARTTTPAPAARPVVTSRPGEVPVGTELDVRLQSALSSGTVTVEERFEATTLVDLIQDARTLIPAGSVMRGVVTSVEPATRTNRTARMTLSFDQVTVANRAYPIRVTVTEAIESEGIRGEAGRAGAGAGIGAVIGGLLGGVKGAIAGILVGGGGAIAATEGRQVELPAGAVLRVRFDSAVVITPR